MVIFKTSKLGTVAKKIMAANNTSIDTANDPDEHDDHLHPSHVEASTSTAENTAQSTTTTSANQQQLSFEESLVQMHKFLKVRCVLLGSLPATDVGVGLGEIRLGCCDLLATTVLAIQMTGKPVNKPVD